MGAGPNAVLCKTCNGLLCVLERPRVDNPSAGSLKLGARLGVIGPIGFRPALYVICILLLDQDSVAMITYWAKIPWP